MADVEVKKRYIFSLNTILVSRPIASKIDISKQISLVDSVLDLRIN